MQRWLSGREQRGHQHTSHGDLSAGSAVAPEDVFAQPGWAACTGTQWAGSAVRQLDCWAVSCKRRSVLEAQLQGTSGSGAGAGGGYSLCRPLEAGLGVGRASICRRDQRYLFSWWLTAA